MLFKLKGYIKIVISYNNEFFIKEFYRDWIINEIDKINVCGISKILLKVKELLIINII